MMQTSRQVLEQEKQVLANMLLDFGKMEAESQGSTVDGFPKSLYLADLPRRASEGQLSRNSPPQLIVIRKPGVSNICR